MICPSCLTKYPADARKCASDGADLVHDEALDAIDRELAAGDKVGEYEIVEKLGQGGFGAVYRAVQPLIGTKVAVKILSRQFSVNAQMVSRFVDEARAVNQIRSRNIINIFSFGQLPDGRRYYVMELLEGMPFDRYLAKQGRLTVQQAFPILRGIARALDAAHGKGILHRDLKPENVFIVFDEDGRVEPKLLDFGLVKLLTETSGNHKTKTGTPMGTPYYMSPEQCRGLECDRRTDVYSFGALVYETITGEVPFDGESQMDILVKHMTAEPPAASARVPETGAAVDVVIRRMMAKERGDRPPSVGDALKELLAAAGIARLEDSGDRLPTPGPESARTLATVDTLIADEASSSPAGVRVVSAPAHGTFLGAEADVVPQKKSRTKIIAVAALASIAVIGVVGGLATLRSGRPTESGVVQATNTPAASPSPPPPPAPVMTTVSLRVDGAPAGATVAANGKELGAAPGPFVVDRGADLRISIQAKGYRSRDVAIAPTADVVLPVTLEKLPAAAPVATGKKAGGKVIHSDLEGFDK